MNEDIPTWMVDRGFIEKVFQKSENDDKLRVLQVVSKRATSKGDNYTSNMFRLNVDYIRSRSEEQEKKSIIVKVAPLKEGPHRDFVVGGGLFNTEISMMTNTLQKMNQLLGNPRALSAKAMHTQLNDTPFLIMEDLAELGYIMASRHNGFDMEHSIIAIQGLAKFHASSIAIYEKEPAVKNIYKNGIFQCHNPEMQAQMNMFLEQSLQSIAEEVSTWPEPVSKYGEKILKLSKHIDKVMNIFVQKPDESEFNVINHGDCWVNNMLFKYDSHNKPIKHIFVDFQMCRYGSPAFDLLYFFGTSLIDDVYFNERDTLLREYLNKLTTLMKQFDCKTKIPSMDELKHHLKQRAAAELVASVTVFPLILVEKKDVLSVDEMLQQDKTYRSPGIKSKRFRESMAKRLPIYDQLQLFDV